ncbi:MAG TPA: peptide chain release factor 2 [Dehalococcoidia bacterium]|nr:peptide chain release factor 2 [Dehalococcoidia bacterium]
MLETRTTLDELNKRIEHVLRRLDVPAREREIAELEAKSAEPGFWDDSQNAQAAMRRLSDARDTVETWRSIQTKVSELADLLELAEAEGDEGVIAEVATETEALARQLEEMELDLSLSGEYDRRSAILTIHAGAGGTDSQDWAEMLMRMYLRWADKRKYKAEVLDVTPGEEAGIKSATIEIAGRNAFGYLKGERGVHRLVRISPYDSSKSRHTSFALAEVLPEVESGAEVDINPDDLRIDTFRAGGHGGQNVQKNSTAVRITHIPSGIVVQCQNERSQGRNKDSAMKVLESRLLELELRRQAEERQELKGQHVSAEWGNQIRSYVLHPYKMVKDHRTDYETSNAEAILDGDLDELLRAYQKATIGDD